MPPFFMTTTIKVDGTKLPMDWQAQQESNPTDPVDLIVLSTDLTTGAPGSTASAGDGNGESVPQTTTTKSTTKSKK